MAGADRLAFDRASARSIDQAGHLHVSRSVLSSASVCPYVGSEIVGWEELGLEPNRTYQMLRDPAALEASAASFNNKPLTVRHRPQSANDHDKDITVGAIGSVRWEAPCLVGELTVWDREGIDLIESDEQSDLSLGYFYRAVPEPGVYEGARYDMRMIDIVGNHCTLVKMGRVPGAFVGDSNPFSPTNNPQPKEPVMAKRNTAPTPRAALLASGALTTYLRPKLAADKAIDVAPLVAGVTKASFKASIPKIKAALDAAMKGKLAQDADLDEVTEVLEAIAPLIEALSDDEPAGGDPAMVNDDGDGDVLAMLKGKVSDEDLAKIAAILKPASSDPVAQDADKDKDDKMPTVTKTAMDAAIKLAADSAAKTAETATVARLQAVRVAEREVHPFIGALDAAPDNAPAIYKLALDARSVDLTGVPPEAYGAVLRAMPKPDAKAVPVSRVAMDAAASAEYAKRFPNSNRLAR